jgi:hypothetical protein
MNRDTQYRPLIVDFLGSLRTLLGDLVGIDALAYELIQNADDVKNEKGLPASSTIEFDVCDDALYVCNDGVFREIDFERMQSIAHGGKANEDGTTGTFGIGFTAVYQITDNPEIFSANQHWIIDPAQKSAEKRIAVEDAETQGTLFKLPWAFSADSILRKELKRSPVSPDDLNDYCEKFALAALRASLFLKQIDRLVVKRNGQVIVDVSRRVIGNTCDILKNGLLLAKYRIFNVDFGEEAEKLKARFPNIESKRKSKVSVALDITNDVGGTDGLYYAVLPTQKATGLPFSICADFYTVASRKDIKLADDYCSVWNQSALRAAAKGIAQGLIELRDELGTKVLWPIIRAIYDLSSHPLGKESMIFWEVVTPYLRNAQVVLTSTGDWVTPSTAKIAPQKTSDAAIGILEEFGIAVVHKDLMRHADVLLALGASELAITSLLVALKTINPQGDKKYDDYVPSLRDIDGWIELDSLLSLLIDANTNNESLFGTIPLAPCADRVVRFIGNVYSNLDNTRRAFPNFSWLHSSLVKTKIIHEACRKFSLRDAVNSLEQISKNGMDSERFELFFDWLSERTGLLSRDHESRERLRRLPIWPISGQWGNLIDASLPGNFSDTLQIANIVDVSRVKDRTDLFKELDVKALDFAEYIHNHLRRAFASGSLTLSKRRSLIELLCSKLNGIQQDYSLRETLAKLPIVECAGGGYVRASEAHLPTELHLLLNNGGKEAIMPPGIAIEQIQKLYVWLGIQQSPSPETIVAGIQQICKQPPNDANVARISGIVRSLGKRFDDTESATSNMQIGTVARNKIQATTTDRFGSDFAKLKIIPWLPAMKRNQRLPVWHVPSQLHNTFRKYLFESQGVFVDLPVDLQQRTGGFLAFLGLKSEPQVEMVVEHVLACSQHTQPINVDVYRFLNDQVDKKPESLKPLTDSNCIFIDEKLWIKPGHAYWNPHPFGKARFQLDKSFDKYRRLFAFLGVKDVPSTIDYADVLLQLSVEFERDHHRLSNNDKAIIQVSWEGLSAGLEEPLTRESAEEAIQKVKDAKVVLDSRGMLVRPSQILFADRNELINRFGDFGRSVTIPIQQSTFRALETAGVKRFSQAVTLHIVENAPANASDYAAINPIIAFKPLLQRVVQASTINLNDINQEILHLVQIMPASHLLVQYELSLPWLDRKQNAEPESSPAVFDFDSNYLYISVLPYVHWPAVAKELAHAILFNGEVGLLASPFTNILRSASFEEASNLLDDLGFSRIEHIARANIPESNMVTLVGEQMNVDHHSELDATFSPDVISPDQVADNALESEETPSQLAAGEAEPKVAIRQPPKPPTQPASPRHEPKQQDDSDQPDTKHDAQHGTWSGTHNRASTTGASSSSSPRHERLRSYVINKGQESSAELAANSPEVKARIDQIDQAGIALVMQFEAKQKRQARELAHDHEGFDIESIGDDGIRYIEVKSIGGEWDKGRPASLSPAQMLAAKRYQDHFWLYVVEFALDERRAKIHVIQDPYKHISQFLFDDGWRSAAVTHFVQ